MNVDIYEKKTKHTTKKDFRKMGTNKSFNSTVDS